MIFFKNKKILILGCAGFTGTWMCIFLLLLKAKVYGVSKKERKNKFFEYLGLRKRISYNSFDITNFSKLSKIINKLQPDIIIHLASQSIIQEAYINPLKTINTNIIGLSNLLEIVRNINTQKKLSVFVATSDKCYDPNNKSKHKEDSKLGCNEIYSASKACQELITKGYYEAFLKNKKNVFLVTCRAGNILGPGDYNKGRIIPDILQSILYNKKLKIRNLKSTRPWQSILYCCYYYLKIIYHINKANINFSNWNVGPSKSFEVKKIIQILEGNKIFKKNNLLFKSKIMFEETKKLEINNSKLKRHFKKLKKENFKNIIILTFKYYFLIEKNKKNKSFLFKTFSGIANNFIIKKKFI
jgi:CDP-glucose 4,6-dehydratase